MLSLPSHKSNVCKTFAKRLQKCANIYWLYIRGMLIFQWHGHSHEYIHVKLQARASFINAKIYFDIVIFVYWFGKFEWYVSPDGLGVITYTLFTYLLAYLNLVQIRQIDTFKTHHVGLNSININKFCHIMNILECIHTHIY